MFEQNHFNGFRGNFSGNQIVALVLTILSVAFALYILVNLKQITESIAIGVANLLTAGVPVLLFAIVIFVIFPKARWGSRRRHW